ncbi:hypothetical protein T01_12309 [Trichinella spiralis]|uniref:Integrase catalytic domain-containing protein n=1 Tax=Trichinella spiralis TaxID=6334 RepID=A0A0V1BTV3_TRISP|nr:hypothetical protein T01_12309 [Trichinella spiralis]
MMSRVMQALRRFIARRGRPEIIQSDNFRSFKAAASELRQLWRHVDVDRVQRELVGHRIHWKFITERAPWMGGYWERLVRSIKESLRKILGKALLDEEELRTTLCEVEASLNARPLTFVGDEDHERHPLSPFQLLTGRAYVDFLAVEAHDPEWQPVGRGAPQWCRTQYVYGPITSTTRYGPSHPRSSFPLHGIASHTRSFGQKRDSLACRSCRHFWRRCCVFRWSLARSCTRSMRSRVSRM